MRPIAVRFALIFAFLLAAVVVLPTTGLASEIPPILAWLSIGLVSNLFSLLWIVWGKGVRYRVYFAVLIDFFLITFAVHYLGGIESTISWVYAVALIAIATINSLRVGVYAALVSSLMNAALLLAEFKGIIPHRNYGRINPLFINQDINYLSLKLFSDTILFFAATIVSGVLSQRLIRSKEEVERRNREIVDMQELLQEYMGGLEKTVAERTASLTMANEQLRKEIAERRRAEEALKESESRYRTLVDDSLTAICLIQDGKFVFANKRLSEMSGYGAEELVGKEFVHLLHPDDSALIREVAEKRLSGLGGNEHYHARAITKSGNVVWVETFGSLVEHKGRPAILANILDITDRKRAEEKLRSSEERLSIVFEFAPDAYYLNDQEGKFIDGNKAAEELIGYKKEELIGKSFLDLDLLPDDQVAKAAALLIDSRQGKAAGLDELVLKRKGADKVAVEIRTFPVQIENQSLILGIARDITERRRAEELLRQSEEKYRTLLDAIEIGFYETDLKGNLVFVNDTIQKHLGYSAEELLGMNYRGYADEQDVNTIYKAFNTVYRTGQADKGFVCNVITKEGARKTIEFTGSLVRDAHGKPIGFRGLSKDITARRQAEEQLRRSEEKYRTLFEESKDVISITTPEGRLLDINPAGVQLFGASSKEELLKLNVAQYIYADPTEREKLAKAIDEHGFVKDHEVVMKSRSGNLLNFLLTATAVCDDNGNIVAYRGIMHDVTEKKHLEQQLFQAQKMESIGTLAGGIAHDFNNLLGGILGYASFMKTKMSNDHKFFSYVDTIERSAMRAAELTSQLLGFARGGKYDTKPVNLNDIVRETLKIIGRTFDKSIEIKTHLAGKLPVVEADATQIQQVLMNLCVNALDAMPVGGELTIGTELAILTDDYVRTHLGAKRGSYVVLSVTDTGIGMDKETMKKIFDPFFTTKEKGKGTGLGLAMVYGVIKNHGGSVRVYSEPGAGSTFKVYLPANGVPEAKERFATRRPRGGNELVLLVDDEEAIRSLARDTLESFGYRVLLAENGKEAIEIYRLYKDTIGLVILDMVMPTLGGRETFLKLKELNPNVRALLSTGYSQNGKAKEILDSGVMGFVQKPYQVEELLQKMRTVLDAKV